ncbi:putative actin family protein [Lyophyllum shimeji]|uniref:Actin-like protein ARP6 n=1 Tax=Lyophyllum shimeji TaxID=47721 RepID=A0A9P3PNV6_LYOSH|nr:putative actin family protein [Lyophyllum shimeji]
MTGTRTKTFPRLFSIFHRLNVGLMPGPVVVLDNGAYTIKAGISVGGQEQEPPRIIPNAVVRSKGDKMTYFGHEFARCKDYSSLHYRLPFEKGYLVDWDAQKAVWDGIFSSEVLAIDTTESSLVITEPYFNLPKLQEVYDQFVFEEYEFQAYYRCTPASLIPHGTISKEPRLPKPECIVVIDSGFSYTHVVPLLNGNVMWSAVKRLDVGGKLLTNQLKELVSFRQWNMMDETYIMNDVKESCCYVSQNYKSDLETCRFNSKSNPIVQEYVLPDLSSNRKGRIRQADDIVAESDQILVMNNERFAVPELLFRPDDIGLDQSGLAATVALSISLLPQDLQGMFWANIGLIGGNTKFPGFRSRLMSELRSLAPIDCEVVIYECDDPITEAYRAAMAFARKPEFTKHLVTRVEYAESGSNASRRKFCDWKPHESEKEKPKEAAKAKGKQREDDRSQATSKPTRTRSRATPLSTTTARRR